MEARKETYSRIRRLNTEDLRENESKYEVIMKDGIKFLNEEELTDIKGVISRTLKGAFANNQNAQDILIFEGEKPEIRVKGRWKILEECPKWEQKHFNYFLFNMSMISTQSRTGKYHIGEEIVRKDKGDIVGKSKVDYEKEKVDIRSNQIGKRILDKQFFTSLMRDRGGSYDYSLNMGDKILRCHVYSVYGSGDREEVAGLAIRVVPKKIPKTRELNLPDKLEEITNSKGGLFLVSGRTGDGKSTTVASIVNKFNRDQNERRVITVVEDPIEFVHKSQNARIIQRRVGENVPSYERATNDSLRESSDIVVLGELRSGEEMSNALRLAEVGKLVIATIHANSVPHTVDRFVGEFLNEQEQYRTRLLENLLGILHQNLIVYEEEQFPLSSLLFINDEDSRRELRKGKITREVIIDTMKDKNKKWSVSREDWYEEKLDKAVTIQDDINNGKLNREDLEEHEKKLLKLLNEDAKEVILGECR